MTDNIPSVDIGNATTSAVPTSISDVTPYTTPEPPPLPPGIPFYQYGGWDSIDYTKSHNPYTGHDVYAGRSGNFPGSNIYTGIGANRIYKDLYDYEGLLAGTRYASLLQQYPNWTLPTNAASYTLANYAWGYIYSQVCNLDMFTWANSSSFEFWFEITDTNSSKRLIELCSFNLYIIGMSSPTYITIDSMNQIRIGQHRSNNDKVYINYNFSPNIMYHFSISFKYMFGQFAPHMDGGGNRIYPSIYYKIDININGASQCSLLFPQMVNITGLNLSSSDIDVNYGRTYTSFPYSRSFPLQLGHQGTSSAAVAGRPYLISIQSGATDLNGTQFVGMFLNSKVYQGYSETPFGDYSNPPKPAVVSSNKRKVKITPTSIDQFDPQIPNTYIIYSFIVQIDGTSDKKLNEFVNWKVTGDLVNMRITEAQTPINVVAAKPNTFYRDAYWWIPVSGKFISNDYYPLAPKTTAIPNGSITFQNGIQSFQLNIYIGANQTSDGSKTFNVELFSPSIGLILDISSAKCTLNPGKLAKVEFINSKDIVTYSNMNVAVKCYAFPSNSTSTGETVSWRISQTGTSVSASLQDFAVISGVINIPLSSVDQVFQIPIKLASGHFINGKSFYVQLYSSSSGVFIGSKSLDLVTVNYSDSMVDISFDPIGISNYTDNLKFIVTATLSKNVAFPSSVSPRIVYPDLYSSLTQRDFVGSKIPGGTLTFGVNDLTKTFEVDLDFSVVGRYVSTRKFNIVFSNPTGLISLSSSVTIPCTLNYTKITEVSSVTSPTSIIHKNTGTNSVTYTVTLNQLPTVVSTLYWSLTDGFYTVNYGTFTTTTTNISYTIPVTIYTDFNTDTFKNSPRILTFTVKGNESVYAAPPKSVLNIPYELDDIGIITFTPSDIQKTDGKFIYVANIDKPLNSVQHFNWSISSMANIYQNFNLYSGTITFDVGVTTGEINLTCKKNTQYSPDKHFNIMFSGLTPSISINQSVTGTVLNTFVPTATVGFNTHNVYIFDFDTVLKIPIFLNNQLLDDVTVDWVITGTDSSVFTNSVFPKGTITLPKSTLSNSLSLSLSGGIIKNDVTFTVTLSNPISSTILSLGSIISVVVTIRNTTPNISFMSSNVSVKETNQCSIGIVLDRPATLNQTINWKVSPIDDGVITHFPNGYPSGTLQLNTGLNSVIFYIPIDIYHDNIVTDNFKFKITFDPPTCRLVIIDPKECDVTILNTDLGIANVSFSTLNVSSPEDRMIGFNVVLSQVLSTTEIVVWSVIPTQNCVAADFEGTWFPTGTLTFTAGVISQNIIIQPHHDTIYKFDRKFNVVLSAPSSHLLLSTSAHSGNDKTPISVAYGTITDDTSPPSFSIVAPSPINEGNSGNTTFEFIVSIDKQSIYDHAVNWVLTSSSSPSTFYVNTGPATNYPSGITTITSGNTSVKIDIFVIGNILYEPDKYFTITISNPTNNAIIGTASAIAKILNDDSISNVSISCNTSSKLEGDGSVVSWPITILLDSPAYGGDQSVDWIVAGVNPNPSTKLDFGGIYPSGSVTIPNGSMSVTFNILTYGNTTPQPDRKFSVTLINPSQNLRLSTSFVVLTIIDDDYISTIDIQSLVSQLEGDVGYITYNFNVTSDKAMKGDQTVDWVVTSSNMIATDFVGNKYPSGTLLLPNGSNGGVVSVNVNSNIIYQRDRSFTVTLKNPSLNIQIRNSIATGIILDDDPLRSVGITAPNSSLNEGNVGDTLFPFYVDISGPIKSSQSVNWVVSSLFPASTFDSNGVYPSGTVNFDVGNLRQVINIPVVGNLIVEPNKLFTVTLSNPSSGLVLDANNTSANMVIVNDDLPIVLSIVGPSSPIHSSNSQFSVPFTINFSKPMTQECVIYWTAAPVANMVISDFVNVTGSMLLHVDGSNSITFNVNIVGISAISDNKVFSVSLRNPSVGVSVDPNNGTATATIINTSIVTANIIAPPDTYEGNSGITIFSFLVNLDKPLTSDSTLSWVLTSTDAVATDFDYAGSMPFGTVTIPANSTNGFINIRVIGNIKYEINKLITVTISNPSTPKLIIGIASASCKILNDDNPPFVIITAPPPAKEGNVTFNFTLSTPYAITTTETVNWTVVLDQTTVDNFDYNGVIPSGTITFNAGDTTETIGVKIKAYTDVEPNRSFSVKIVSVSSGLSIGVPSIASTTILNDNTPVIINITAPAAKNEGNIGNTKFTFPITLSDIAKSVQTITYTISGDVTANDLASPMSGFIHFNVGDNNYNLDVLVIGNTNVEPDKTLTVTLSSPSSGLTLGPNYFATTRILNDDYSMVYISVVGDASILEDNTKPFTYTLEVTLDKQVPTAQHVDWKVDGGTALAEDFLNGVIPSGTINFAANETVKVFYINCVGDMKFEPNQTFVVKLLNPSSSISLSPNNNQVTCTIVNSITITHVNFSNNDLIINDTDLNAVFYIALDGYTNLPASIDYVVTGNNLLFVNNILPSGTLNIGGQETNKTIAVSLNGGVINGNQSFTIMLSNPKPSGVLILGTKISSNCTVVDTTPVVSFSVDQVSQAESITSYIFPITIDKHPVNTQQSIDWIVQPISSGLNTTHFLNSVYPSGTVNFNKSDLSYNINLTTVNNSIVEPDLQFKVTLLNPSTRIKIGTKNTCIGIIVNDDFSKAIVSINPLTLSGLENSILQYTVKLNIKIPTAESVGWKVDPIGSTLPTDFQGNTFPSGTINFAANTDTGTIQIQPYHDTIFKLPRKFTVTLINPSTNLIIDTNNYIANGTINDDTPPPQFSVYAPNAMNEGNSGTTLFSFKISLDKSSIYSHSVNWVVSSSVAFPSAFNDGTGPMTTFPSGVVTINVGDTTAYVAILVNGNTTIESDKPFTMTLSNPTNSAMLNISSTNTTILNDDYASNITITAPSPQNEGDSGLTTFEFIVTLDKPAEGNQSVQWAVSSSIAVPADFDGGVFPSGTLSIPNGTNSAVIDVKVKGNAIPEQDKPFTVTLSNPSPNLIIKNGSAVGTILNDDYISVASISTTTSSLNEGNSGDTLFSFAITLDKPVKSTQTVVWTVSSSVAVATDFDTGGAFPSGTIQFNVGDSSKTFTVPVIGNTWVEPDKSFTVTLSNPSQLILISQTNGSVVVTIKNDDSPITVSIFGPFPGITEGNTGNKIVQFNVTTGNLTQPNQTIGWVVQPVSGIVASDFVGGVFPFGTISLIPGTTTYYINTIKILGNILVQSDKVFKVVLQNPTVGVAISNTNGSATYTVLDDDFSTLTLIAPPDSVEGNSGDTIFNFTIRLDKVCNVDLTIVWHATSTNSTASSYDYNGNMPSGTVILPAGNLTGTINVKVLGNAIVEPNKVLTVVIDSATPVAKVHISNSSATCNILNDDVPPVISIIAPSNQSTVPNTAVTFKFTVSASTIITSPQTVNWVVSSTDATATDFVGGVFPSGTISFNVNDTQQFITINVAPNLQIGPSKVFKVTLTSPSTGISLDPIKYYAVVTILNNNAPSTISISAPSSQNEGDAGTTTFAFPITVTPALLLSQIITWTLTSNIAVTNDFSTPMSGIINFNPGDTSYTLNILVKGNTIPELDKPFTITLSNPSVGLVIGVGSVTTAITNDDFALATLKVIGAASRPEDNTNPTSYVFEVDLDRAIPSLQSVDWSVSSSNTTATNEDFANANVPSGTVKFNPNITSQQFTIYTVGDKKVEPNQTFNVIITNPSSLVRISNPNNVICTIVNTVTPSNVSIYAPPPIDPGPSGIIQVKFTVKLDNTVITIQTVSWTVSSNTMAISRFGGSYPSGTIQFAPGDFIKTISISVSGTTDIAPDTDFTVTLSNPTSLLVLSIKSATVTILNTNVKYSIATISPTAASLPEGNLLPNGQPQITTFYYFVNVDVMPTILSHVYWQLQSNDLIANNYGDGNLMNGVAIFDPNNVDPFNPDLSLSQPINVLIKGNNVKEPNKNFTLTLTTSDGGIKISKTKYKSTGTVLNDDSAIIVSLSRLNIPTIIPQIGDAIYKFSVSLSGVVQTDQIVQWEVTSDCPTLNSNDFDYDGLLLGQYPTGSVVFKAGTTIGEIDIVVRGTADYEPSEYFTLSLTNTTSGVILGNDNSITVTIPNTNPKISKPVVSISPINVSVNKVSDTTEVDFNILLDIPCPTQQETITYKVLQYGTNQVNPSNISYNVEQNVTIYAGKNSASIAIIVNTSINSPNDLTFKVVITSVTNGLSISNNQFQALGTVIFP